VKLSRQTRDQLWRDLLARGAAPPDVRPSSYWIVPVSLLLTVLALYVFTKI
jgi:hypothetical protein